MKTIRIIGPAAVLLLVGGMIAGNAQARALDQNRNAQQQPNPGKGHDKGKGGDASKAKSKQAQGPKDRAQASQARGQDRAQAAQAQAPQARGQGRALQAQQQAAARQAQQRRIVEQRQRDTQYRLTLDRQVKVAQQQAAQLQRQNRKAQMAAQRQYLANLRLQRQRLQATRDYSRDPAFSAAPAYRYRRAGVSYVTTQYGADVLRQAVNNGYQQGLAAGQADRQDGWRSDYQTTYAYQDGNYGYDARYVSQSDYNYYFRQGFQRGYQDGYANSRQYGVVTNGSPSILSSVLSAILGLIAIK